MAYVHIGRKNGHRNCALERRKQTNLKKFGVENTFQSKEIKEKIKQTNLKKRGVEYASQSEEVKEKIKQTNLDRRGVENPFALKRLLEEEKICETCIITDRTQVPPIQWTDSEEKTHIYFVDIFIPSQNRCIEVKSLWTYNLPNVQEKREATLNLGYNYEIWIFDPSGELLNIE